MTFPTLSLIATVTVEPGVAVPLNSGFAVATLSPIGSVIPTVRAVVSTVTAFVSVAVLPFFSAVTSTV